MCSQGTFPQASRGRIRSYLPSYLTVLLAITILFYLTTQFRSKSFSYQREASAGVFSLICLLGIVAAIYPSRVRSLLRKGSIHQVGSEGHILGHHPTCGSFTNHVLNVGDRVYCSGCLGLTIGALISVGYTIVSLFFIDSISGVGALFVVGLALIVIGILQHVIDGNNPMIHSVLNALLVFGVALARSAAQVMNDGIVLDAYFIALMFYIIQVRIELSQIDHSLVCAACQRFPCADSSTFLKHHRNASIMG